MAENIAENWKVFSGANKWEGLLDKPINPDFLRYLIHYGERVQAIRDAFNSQKLSNTFGLPRFPPEELFSKVGLEKANPFKYEVLAEVRKLVDYYGEKGEEVSITVAGYSLGAALATITAMDIVSNGFNKPTGSGKTFPVTAFAYASPRVGDKGLLNVFSDLIVIHILRISNFLDPVPVIPLFDGYVAVANAELIINSSKSPYLKDTKPHELEIYLHGIAGYNGQFTDFDLVVPRDLALVNKTLYILKDNDKLKVLPEWWHVRNNLMTQHENGFWDIDTDYVADPPSEDDIAVLTKNALA
ncbi:unnamed protein product [Dovyalis caffra]|uniref:Phospholipase A1 n=1 Tax=Dovyalis caffra TaxID=77055 RepID=A0AAV1QSN8_9ROSI|nr:unnamed protein product [Dovyalis caffra]